jgi:hypothetical protein
MAVATAQSEIAAAAAWAADAVSKRTWHGSVNRRIAVAAADAVARRYCPRNAYSQ